MVKCVAVWITLLISLTSLGQKPFDPAKFPSSWEMLTAQDNQQVIYNPCDAQNRTFRISSANGKYTLLHALGQMSDEFTITNITTKDNKTFTIAVEPGPPFEVEVHDKDFKTALWSRGSVMPEECVNSRYVGEYPVVKQPCRDCWPAEQCPDEEKTEAISYKIEKVNEVGQDKSLSDFVARLQTAINQKDKAYLLSVVDKDIQISFGAEGGGIEAFKGAWKLDSNNSSVWSILGKLISLGGVFYDDNNIPKSSMVNFVFPYISPAPLPDIADPYSIMVITGANVNLREGPSKTAKVLGQLTYDLVVPDLEHSAPFQGPNPGFRDYEWYKVTTLDKKSTGFVYYDFIWSPMDYRMYLKKKDGKWRIAILIEGD